MAKVTKSAKKTKDVSIFESLMMGSTTPSMGELEMASAKPKKATKTTKTKGVSMLDAAIKGATTPPLGKSEKGKSAAEKTTKTKKK